MSESLPSLKNHIVFGVGYLMPLNYVFDCEGSRLDPTHHRDLFLRNTGVLSVIKDVPPLILLGLTLTILKLSELLFRRTKPLPRLHNLVIRMFFLHVSLM